jgi:hypothetical protein
LGAQLARKRSADVISLEVIAASENWVDSLIESVLVAALDQPEANEPEAQETEGSGN